MSKPTIIYLMRHDVIEKPHKFGMIYFLYQWTDAKIICSREASFLEKTLSVGIDQADIAGIVIHQEDWDESGLYLAHDIKLIRDLLGPAIPIAAIEESSASDWPKEIADDQFVSRLSLFDSSLPAFAEKLLRTEISAEPNHPNLGLDLSLFPRWETEEYILLLDRARQLTSEQIKKELVNSQSSRQESRGEFISTFAFEPTTRQHLSTNQYGLHRIVNEFLDSRLESYSCYMVNAGIVDQVKFEPFIYGLIYHRTGILGVPVLSLAISKHDWENEKEFKSNIQRVVDWGHHQRQVIPMLCDGTVL